MGVNMSYLAPGTPEGVVQSLKIIQAVKFYTIANASVAIWDWLVSLSAEYELIWKAPWSLEKFLYLGARYSGLIDLSWIIVVIFGPWNYGQCIHLGKTLPSLSLLVWLFSDLTLAARVLALWDGSRIILGIVSVAIVVSLSLQGFAISVFTPIDVPGLLGCFVHAKAGKGHILLMYWVFPACIDLLFFLLTLYKAVALRRAAIGGMGPLLYLIVRDGMGFFFLIFLTNLSNAILFIQPNEAFTTLQASFAIAMTSIFSARMSLNLRHYAVQGGSSTSGPGHTSLKSPTKPAGEGHQHHVALQRLPTVRNDGYPMEGVRVDVISHVAKDDEEIKYAQNDD